MLDEDGNPLGTIKVPEGQSIDDFDAWDQLIPLEKPNPVTEGRGAAPMVWSTALLVGAVVVLALFKKRVERDL